MHAVPEHPWRDADSSSRMLFAMAVTSLALLAFIGAIDAPLLAPALPDIAKSTGASSLQAFWMSTSYLLAVVTSQPVYTTLSGIFGRKPTLYVCCSLFATGLVIFGTSTSPNVLIFGRTVQGLGGGGLEALSEIILTDITTLEERPLYLGMMAFFWASANIIGPLTGGSLVQHVSWRWLAWVIMPLLGVASLLIAPVTIPGNASYNAAEKLRRVDWLGIMLFVFGVTATLIPITAGGVLYSWYDYRTWVPLSTGLACLLLLIPTERRAKEPMLPPRIFRNSSVSAALFVSFVTGILFWCLFFYPAIFFQSVWEHKPLTSAVDGLSFTVPQATAEFGTALLVDYLRSCRWLLIHACVLATAGCGALTALSVDIGVFFGRALFVPAGIGLGMTYPALTLPVQACVRADDVGVATGLLVFSRNLGAVVGMAAGSAIFTNQFSTSFGKADLSYHSFGIDSANDAIGLVNRLANLDVSSSDMAALLRIYASSFRAVAIFVVATAATSVVGAFCIKAVVFADHVSVTQEATDQQLRDETTPRYGTFEE